MIGPGGVPAVALALFLAGLAGGVTHCAGMCAPFVLAQAGAVAGQSAAGGMLGRLSGAALAPTAADRKSTKTRSRDLDDERVFTVASSSREHAFGGSGRVRSPMSLFVGATARESDRSAPGHALPVSNAYAAAPGTESEDQNPANAGKAGRKRLRTIDDSKD